MEARARACDCRGVSPAASCTRLDCRALLSPLTPPPTPPHSSSPDSLLEHEGHVNMLRPLLLHMEAAQAGLGVVAVSKRYAER